MMETPTEPTSSPSAPSPKAVFTVWVIYDHPRDFPDHFVVRRQYAIEGGHFARDEKYKLADTLEEARSLVPFGLVCVGPFADDDPTIVETWI